MTPEHRAAVGHRASRYQLAEPPTGSPRGQGAVERSLLGGIGRGLHDRSALAQVAEAEISPPDQATVGEQHFGRGRQEPVLASPRRP